MKGGYQIYDFGTCTLTDGEAIKQLSDFVPTDKILMLTGKVVKHGGEGDGYETITIDFKAFCTNILNIVKSFDPNLPDDVAYAYSANLGNISILITNSRQVGADGFILLIREG